MKLDLNDVMLTPQMGDITSRKEIETRYKNKIGNLSFLNGRLPIFSAPMDRVISDDNRHVFDELGLNVVLPRDSNGTGNDIKSYSIKGLKDLMNIDDVDDEGRYLIDIANGHNLELVEIIKDFKSKYPKTFLMVGNIANPKDFEILSDAGADAVRMSIGSGNSCSTSINTGVGYGMASLINETYRHSLRLRNPAMIIADGGMRGYSDVIKSLALGADGVMVGGLFNKALESCSKNYLFGVIPISNELSEKAFDLKLPIYKIMRGMSTTEVQKDWGRKGGELRASEGLVTKNRVQYRLSDWVWHMDSYLRSAMSYVNARTLDKFIGEVQWEVVSTSVYDRIHKK